MSAQRQGGQLRQIIIRNIRQSNLSEKMVDVLKKNNQVYTGSLAQAILSRDLSRNLRLSYSINKEMNVIENVVVTFRNVVSSPRYAEFLDERLASQTTNEISASPKSIEKWILAKVKNGTWKGKYGDNYYTSNNYSTRREKRDFSKGARGGSSKDYLYPLVGAPKSKKARARLAYIISRSINESQQLKNTSRFITDPSFGIIAEFAILRGLEQFNEVWLADLGINSINKVISIFE